MLPMAYYPKQNQIQDLPFQPPAPLPEEAPVWKKACTIALEFWKIVSQDTRISSDFRFIATENQKILRTQNQWVDQIL